MRRIGPVDGEATRRGFLKEEELSLLRMFGPLAHPDVVPNRSGTPI